MSANRPSTPEAAGAIPLVIALAFAGGYADAYSYLTAGTFTGHVTGNAILASLALARGQFRSLGVHVLAVLLFLAATEAGLLLLHAFAKKQAFVAAMAVEAILVLIGPVPTLEHWPSASLCLIAALCLAMGLQNGIFSKSLGVPLHTNFLTGNMTSLLVHLTPSRKLDRATRAKNRVADGALSVLTTAFVAGAIAAGLASRLLHARAAWLLELPLLAALLLGLRRTEAVDA